jgi:N-alpha-acetyltransferase 40
MADYKTSSRGWKPRAKMAEMMEPNMWYLLVRDASEQGGGVRKKKEDERMKEAQRMEQNNVVSNTPEEGTELAKRILAFLSFLLCYEDNYAVIYIYEIHLDALLRGCGLGAHLMHIVEQIAVRTAVVEKVMLTVFRRNEKARKFYAKLGYQVDEFSPREKRLRGGIVKEADYEILSKSTRSKGKERQIGNALE